MAYSPSPQPATLGTLSSFPNRTRSSITPPLPRVISKRDKKMNSLSERLNAIGANFAQNRDAHYRSQLQGLQLAMSYINNSEPYQDKPLNDNPNDIFDNLSMAVAGNAKRVSQAGARANLHEVPVGTETLVAAYTREINDAMETRDTSLSSIATRYNEAIATIERDAQYHLDVASIEHDQLVTMHRERMINAISKRKAKLMAERETFDVTDTNAVLFHASHLSTTNAASPGGITNHRKTRHARHRLEVEDLGSIMENNKKKRKGPIDTENGSPVRGGDADNNYNWKDPNTDEAQVDGPQLTLERLFDEKHLLPNLQRASKSAILRMSRRRKLNHNVQTGLSQRHEVSRGKGAEKQAAGPASSSSSDEGEMSGFNTLPNADAMTNGGGFIEAPAMDRTANSSYHATRSTGVVSSAATTFAEDLAMPGDIVGRRTAIELMGNQQKPGKKEDDFQLYFALSSHERDTDVQAMKRAMDDMTKGRETKRAKTLMSNSIRASADHIKAAEEMTQESSLRETLQVTIP